MHERNIKLQQHIHDLLNAGVRRTTFYPLIAESLTKTHGQPRPIRRAKAFAHLLDRVEQVVHPHELLAGSILGMWPLAQNLPNMDERMNQARQAVADYRQAVEAGRHDRVGQRWAIMGRDHYNNNIDFLDLQHVAQVITGEQNETAPLPYSEIYRVLELHFSFFYEDEMREIDALPWFASNHLHLNFAKGLRLGLGGIRNQILALREKAANENQRIFYDSTLIATEAAIRFIQRYALTLQQKAAHANNERAKELLRMAAICELIAEHAPLHFHEAIQLTWMLHIISNIGGGSAMSFARFDQYLYPFYRHDLEAGLIAREHAKLLTECVWLKVNEPKMRTVQSLCLSGITPEGRDGTNLYTYICVEVAGEAGEPYPNTCVRVHAETPEPLWDSMVNAIMAGCGQPMLFNDDDMLPGLVRQGYPEHDAREYYPMGCVEIMLSGTMPTYRGAGGIGLVTMIERVLNNGAAAEDTADTPILATGELDRFVSFEAFLDAILAQLRFHINHLMDKCEAGLVNESSPYYDPFASALVDDCLENGRDICQGGARYPRSFVINATTLGTTADSLAAIKRFVYDEAKFSLCELKTLLAENFANHEPIRMLLANQTPAFGNDIAETDELARLIYNAFADTILAYRSQNRAIYAPQMFSYHGHVRGGEVTPATPNGRQAATTLSNGIGPSQGHDRHGPTALINSITRLDYSKLTGGCALNIKMNPGFVAGPEGHARLKALLQTYIRQGGLQVQVNMVDRKVLRKAQQNPEQYGHVVVRVGGFCEYFVNLDCKLQDEIISRTAQVA